MWNSIVGTTLRSFQELICYHTRPYQFSWALHPNSRYTCHNQLESRGGATNTNYVEWRSWHWRTDIILGSEVQESCLMLVLVCIAYILCHPIINNWDHILLYHWNGCLLHICPLGGVADCNNASWSWQITASSRLDWLRAFNRLGTLDVAAHSCMVRWLWPASKGIGIHILCTLTIHNSKVVLLDGRAHHATLYSHQLHSKLSQLYELVETHSI